MKLTYLLADRELDRLFGFKTELSLSVPQTPKEGIKNLIHTAFPKDPLYREHYEPTFWDVFVVDRIDGKGLVGIVDFGVERVLNVDDVNPLRNRAIRVDVGNQFTYLDNLKLYLTGESTFDKIVVARSRIAPEVRRDMERLVPEPFLRIAINPEGREGYYVTPRIDVRYNRTRRE
ncbi:MAG: hypothetical protein AB1668_06620 [Nanoarchaeota archaeon]